MTDWQAGARPDVEAVAKMWANRPKDNVGIVTGEASGFFVVDIDPKSGGMDSMKALIAEYSTERLPATYAVQTGSGGWHYYFQMPDFEVTNSAKRLPAGIDIRGTGGQVVAPPSVSGVGSYVLRFDRPILPAPDWLLDLLRAPAVTRPFPETDLTPFIAEVARNVAEVVEQTTREQAIEKAALTGELKRLTDLPAAGWDIGWDSTTFEVACNLIELANSERAGLTMDEALIAFTEHCPPIEDGYEPMLKWDSARVKVGDKARVLVAAERPKDFMDDESFMRIDPNVARARGAIAERVANTDGHLSPQDFFGKEGLLAADLAQAIIAMGPIRMGQDGFWWTYAEKGCWVEDRKAVKNRTVALLGNKFRSSHATNAEIIVDCSAPRLIMDKPDAEYMNFANGMLHWRTGEMKAHGPEFESITSFPMPYSPESTCPRFDAFLSSVMSADYVKLAWEMMGYLLYSGNPLQKAFLFHGTGANGKGTLIRVIQAMLGTENTSTQSLDALNSTRFASANLFGKIANLAGDIDGTFQESTAMFKMLTGEDRISGEHKFGNSFTFDSWAVPVFSANKIPGSADVSVGYLRRWVVLEFNRNFEGDPIIGLSDQLIQELPGIAAKAIAGLGPLLDRSRFDVSGEATAGAEMFAMALDQVRQWVDECCMPAPGHHIDRAVLYSRYRSWAEANGIGRLKGSEFYMRLEAHGYASKKVRGDRRFEGIMPIDQAVSSDLESFLT